MKIKGEDIVEGIVAFFVIILPAILALAMCTGISDNIFPKQTKTETYDEEEERQQALEWQNGDRDPSDYIQ